MRYTLPITTIDEAVSDYQSGMTMKAIGQKYGMGRGWLYNILKERKIKARPAHRLIGYAIDETFFDRVDSHEKAICLGFIWADGCISKSKKSAPYLSITLSKIDLAYLQWMNGLMKNERPIYLNDRFAILVAYHPKIVAGLRGLGIYERKSLTIGAPTSQQVPDEFISSFVLGVFEGDGCITSCRGKSYNANIVGSETFCKWMQRLLHERLDISSSITYSPTQKGPPLARVMVGGNRQVIRFMEWMYAKAPHKMDRKYQRYLQLRALYDADMKFVLTPEQKAIRTAHKRRIRAKWTLSEEAKKRIGNATRERYLRKRESEAEQPPVLV